MTPRDDALKPLRRLADTALANAAPTVAAVTGAVAALGASKTLFEILSGDSVGLQEVAFYVGEAAFVVWGGVVGGILISGIASPILFLLFFPLLYVLRDEIAELVAMCIGFGAYVAAVAFAMLYLATLPLAFGYDQKSDFDQGFSAIMGMIALGGGIYLWRHLRRRIQD